MTTIPNRIEKEIQVVESGFNHVPLARRAKAFEMSSEGWGIQLKQIAKYLENADK